jgi:hypothetical protein
VVAGLVVAIVLVALTSLHERQGREYVHYEGVGPGPDSMQVVVGGWPIPYLFDSPYFSPAGSVDLVGGLLGLDDLRPGRFALDVLLAWGAIAAVAWAARRWRGARSPRPHAAGDDRPDVRAPSAGDGGGDAPS